MVGTIVTCHLVDSCDERAVKLNSNDIHRCMCFTDYLIDIREKRKKQAMGVAWPIFIFLHDFSFFLFELNFDEMMNISLTYMLNTFQNIIVITYNGRIHLLSRARFHWKKLTYWRYRLQYLIIERKNEWTNHICFWYFWSILRLLQVDST